MKCPGQDSRYWKPGSIFDAECPKCGNAVEFFQDDSARTCKACGFRFINPKLDLGCAAYCQYAEQCIGSLPFEALKQRESLLRDRVAVEMKRYFGRDFNRIGHALRVARYAEQIGKGEGGNLAVILPAAYLHDIGIKEAERKYQSTSPRYQHQEGPPVARKILSALDAADELIEEVVDIVGHHHHPRGEETVNFKAVYDADLIVNLDEEKGSTGMERTKIEHAIGRAFLTETGRVLAREVLLSQ